MRDVLLLLAEFSIQSTVWQNRCRPFSDIEDEIKLQIRNGVDMGVGLHSRKTAAKIVDHVAKDIIFHDLIYLI